MTEPEWLTAVKDRHTRGTRISRAHQDRGILLVEVDALRDALGDILDEFDRGEDDPVCRIARRALGGTT